MRYGYVRSTKDLQQVDVQRRRLLDAGVPAARLHCDHGSRERPGWASLEVLLRPGDELVVTCIDRLGTTMREVIVIVADLVERRVQVRSLADGIDPVTREGEAMLGLMVRLAGYDRSLQGERIRVGIAAARARGVQMGRPPVDPQDAARTVQRIEQQIRGQGMTVEAAASTMSWSRSTYYRRRARYR